MTFHRILLAGVAILVAGGVWGVELDDLAGESWYGLYMNGDKIGYAQSVVEIDADGSVRVTQDMVFRLAMVGSRQDMQTVTERRYRPDGSLARVQSEVEDPSGRSRFVAQVTDQAMELRKEVGGAETVKSLKPPRESLSDWLKAAAVVEAGPEIGQTFEAYLFEPMLGAELHVTSEVTGMQERIIEGVATNVYEVQSLVRPMGLTSTSYIAESGELLEDQVANGLITMRLEPETMAKDLAYENDTIISNAALVDAPIANPRRRETLTLRIDGPLAPGQRIDDAGQRFERDGTGYRFVGRRVELERGGATLPVDDASVARWLAPSTFVQSDHPRVVAQARDIVGDETDALEATRKLVAWVNENMESAFSARLTNALEVLNSLEGDCTEHSILFVALARAAGLPAREVAGLIYAELPAPGFYFHQWAKVWVGEWMDVDPTFDQVFADATHIKLSEGDLVEQMSLLPVIGQIDVRVVGD